MLKNTLKQNAYPIFFLKKTICPTTSGGTGGGWQGPGPCKEIFPSLSLCKIIKVLLFLKYFF
jgi:hypothetical protein